MTTLTNEEKTGLIQQHKRNIEYSAYNLELTLIEENAVGTPNAETVARLTAEIAELKTKLEALNAELASLNA